MTDPHQPISFAAAEKDDQPNIYEGMVTLQKQIESAWPGARFVFSVAYGEGRIDYTNVPDADRRKKMLGMTRKTADTQEADLRAGYRPPGQEGKE